MKVLTIQKHFVTLLLESNEMDYICYNDNMTNQSSYNRARRYIANMTGIKLPYRHIYVAPLFVTKKGKVVDVVFKETLI